jgi:pimeloyl-ACP methyl ester carboxylesterase
VETTQINTSIGEISFRLNKVENSIPIIFLHGVYYDHNLWNYQAERITDRTVITIDMPFHGMSKNITRQIWTLDDCAVMLLEILDTLEIDKVIAIGHSWGSMTILRAAAKAPERFQSIGLCNMPFQAATTKIKRMFKMQHLMLGFRKFYAKQVAKALYGKETYTKNPALLNILESSISKLTREEIIQTDKSVIIDAENMEPTIQTLKVPTLALKGKEDYVPRSGHLKTKIVAGGHVSPIEVPEEVYAFIKEVIEIK